MTIVIGWITQYSSPTPFLPVFIAEYKKAEYLLSQEGWLCDAILVETSVEVFKNCMEQLPFFPEQIQSNLSRAWSRVETCLGIRFMKAAN